MSESFPVEHEPARNRFVVRLAEGSGELLYAELDGTFDLYHVEVAPVLRGRGVASELVAAACRHAREHGLRLIPSCPYVAWWFGRHPEWGELIAREQGS